MVTGNTLGAFLRSKAGSSFWKFTLFSLVLSIAVGAGFYYSSVSRFTVNKSQEKVTALQLVDAFVTNYSELLKKFPGDSAPVPATFRAHSIELFNKARTTGDVLRLLWVGRAGRAIATPPEDQAMADDIESFVGVKDPKPVSRFLTVGSDVVFRTVYPSIATQQSCVDCHNKVMPKTSWRLNDVMGAFSIDVPAGPFLRSVSYQSLALGLALFLVVSGVGLVIGRLHFQQLKERETANATLERRVEERTEELRKAQDELVRNERLSALGQLTATVAHELRNPLSAIRNTIFTVKEVVAAAGVKIERPLERIERSIKRCDAIITDLLDYTKLREMHFAETLGDAWLADILDEQKLPDGIALVRRLATPGRTVTLDPERLRRVVLNLIENAVQAVAEGHAATVARTVTVSTSLREGNYEIAIADNGPGMAPEVLARIFEPLFSTKSFGTGLGLPTVRQIVEQHGGTIAIGSEVGEGTVARVVLPLVRASAPAPTAASTPASTPAGEIAA
ncbi:MAG: domain S-box protein [Rhodospirillales bacterium]|nr:domain S-box protein [Rhodospirillales bacterium]